MQSRTITIIGGGIAGLSAGCFAQQSGFKSTIFEHHFAPGGVAACWKRKGYLIDGGIHSINGYKPGNKTYEIFKAVGVESPSLYTDMNQYGRFVYEPEDIVLSIGRDLNKFANDVKSKLTSVTDKQFIDELIHCSKQLQGVDISSLGMSKPSELMNWYSKLQLIWEARPAWKVMRKKYTQPMKEYSKGIQTPWLKMLVNSLFTADVPAWFIFMILAGFADGQMGYIKNGSDSFIRAMESKYKSLGGDIRYKKTVSKILTKGGKAYGVKLVDGSEHYSEHVISAGDGYNTIYNLLDGKYKDEKIDQMYITKEICKPFLFSTYGVNTDLSHEPPFTTIVLKKPLKYAQGKMETNSIFLRITNYSDVFAPKGKSVVQVEFETEYDYWADLRKESRQQYTEVKEELSNKILEILKTYYPKLEVEMTDVATPATTQRFTLNRKGAWGGWAMTPDSLKEEIKRTLPRLKNFYMAGQWAMSGGVLPCLYSGKHAVDLIKEGL